MIASDSENSSKQGASREAAGEKSQSLEKGSARGASNAPVNGPIMPEKPRGGAMEVTVEHNIEKAMKILKRKLIKEGLFKELKSRRYYEKPSERKKRKLKESMKKVRKDEARAKKNNLLF